MDKEPENHCLSEGKFSQFTYFGFSKEYWKSNDRAKIVRRVEKENILLFGPTCRVRAAACIQYTSARRPCS